MELFRSEKTSAISLSGREIAVLDAVRKVGPTGACAADLQSAIAAATSKEPRLATLYATILDLQKKGLLEAASSSLPENGGRPRRQFTLTSRGRLAHQLGEEMASHADPLALA
jgi:hypothetical protein